MQGKTIPSKPSGPEISEVVAASREEVLGLPSAFEIVTARGCVRLLLEELFSSGPFRLGDLVNLKLSTNLCPSGLNLHLWVQSILPHVLATETY